VQYRFCCHNVDDEFLISNFLYIFKNVGLTFTRQHIIWQHFQYISYGRTALGFSTGAVTGTTTVGTVAGGHWSTPSSGVVSTHSSVEGAGVTTNTSGWVSVTTGATAGVSLQATNILKINENIFFSFYEN
jgi:hypothetical protein